MGCEYSMVLEEDDLAEDCDLGGEGGLVTDVLEVDVLEVDDLGVDDLGVGDLGMDDFVEEGVPD